MRQFTECLTCACLIDARDAACPFCGASAPRSAAAPTWQILGLFLGLGVADIGCVDKEPSPGDTVALTENNSNTDPTEGEATILDPTNEAEGGTYAGPTDGSETITETDTSGTTTTTTQDPTNSPDASTYAGPDEDSSTEFTTSGTSTGTTLETDPDPSGDASTYAGPDDSFGESTVGESSSG